MTKNIIDDSEPGSRASPSDHSSRNEDENMVSLSLTKRHENQDSSDDDEANVLLIRSDRRFSDSDSSPKKLHDDRRSDLGDIQEKTKERTSDLKMSICDPDTSDEDKAPRENKSRQKKIRKSTKLTSPKPMRKTKERTSDLKMSICDPDTSDEDKAPRENKSRQKKIRKSTKLTSPKPMRMTAKQAMENMQKIKSESNRMLREKEVSLPYHRPKALSLKDIMSRRRPAVSADGKALPIKMNEEQLRQYALALEQRQKEMIELCKSESEEEAPEDDKTTNEATNNIITQNTETNNKEEIANLNDTLYDELCKKNTEIENSDQTDAESHENEKEDQNKIGDNNTLTAQDQPVESMDVDLDDYDLIVEKVSSSEVHKNTTEDSNEKNIPDLKSAITDECAENTQDNSSLEGDASPEMSLVYNDSAEENEIVGNNDDAKEQTEDIPKLLGVSEQKEPLLEHSECVSKLNTEESQRISLHYDNTEERTKTDEIFIVDKPSTSGVQETLHETTKVSLDIEKPSTSGVQELFEENDDGNQFSDDDMNLEDIDKLIEDAEIISSQTKTDCVNSAMLIKEPNLQIKPQLAGSPGMVIDFDGTDSGFHKKLSGIELLKERFSYFARLKTPEELEREKERRIKPGTQHIKLKQELEEKIAEQRSLEWAKRLEEEKQQKQELAALRGEDGDDIDEIEAKLEEKEGFEEAGAESSDETSEEEEEEEMDLENVKEKPRKHNPMIADEAEESDCDGEAPDDENEESDDGGEADAELDDDDEDSESSEEESDKEVDQSKPKKSRILKAFEDSDEENEVGFEMNKNPISVAKSVQDPNVSARSGVPANDNVVEVSDRACTEGNTNEGSEIKPTQDEELQLAQLHKSFSEDLFASQESTLIASVEKPNAPLNGSGSDDKALGTQTFSILETTKPIVDLDIPAPDKLSMGDTQPIGEGDLDAVVGMCSGSFSQSLATSQCPSTQVQSQIGEDILALCTGQFYENQFVSQLDSSSQEKNCDGLSQNQNLDYVSPDNVDKELLSKELNDDPDTNRKENSTDNGSIVELRECTETTSDTTNNTPTKDGSVEIVQDKEVSNIIEDTKLDSQQTLMKSQLNREDNKFLKSLLDELDVPEEDSTKTNNFFADNIEEKENKQNEANLSVKKRFIIESDDEGNEELKEKKKKKLKKKKLAQRALQISDDEDEIEEEQEVEEEDMSEIEETDGTERVVEYDSEENEIEVLPQQLPKKKRKLADFFEQEAELTSEDEWAGSGDEDERGLDRMEREEGDDDTFNQRKLQRELGQIHMRDILDQDKREVRLIQELLFEDGDLGGGGRQRKFRWRNADGEEETGTAYDGLPDTQEEEFESEEQWRKQRHEREMFLKQMQEKEEGVSLNTSINRTTIIKANLSSKPGSSVLLEINSATTEVVESPTLEKKPSKDIPSPKKPFAIFQQNYHGSLLTRGRGALARLAALATPLAGDDEGPKTGSLAPSSKRNFVFAALTPDEVQPKVPKRKAETNAGTPRLVKKMRAEEKQQRPRNSILDHIEI